ncbi:MAG: glucose-6-phosphate isomerase, partial [Tenacibaculum sp.]|nr:glucose-6-phosphate isomerase [Tenacibaculum sp.]
MALKNINPTKTKAWEKLTSHFEEVKNLHLRDLFRQDEFRKERFSVNLNEISFDYSKNRITQETIDLLIELANEVELKDAIEKYFTGDKINATENRAVLHTALRSNSEEPIFVDGKDIKPQIKTTLRKIRAFSNKVISGKWKGYTDKPITDVVNIGVGGSELGSSFVTEALRFYKNHLNTHFVSNVDGDNVAEVLKKLNPETTLFVIVSKSFTTQETMINTDTIRNWFLKSASIFDIAKHFIAVSENLKETTKFGIDKKNVFPMWNWVGGRFSLWSAVGLPISLSVGFDNFKKLLDGAEEMDVHFRNTDFDKNIPILLSLLSVWYNNFYDCKVEEVLSYTQYFKRFIPFLQQMMMESNGKDVDRNGESINYQTGSIIFGGTGTNVQHEFMQLAHQGTKMIPVDFIGFKK